MARVTTAESDLLDVDPEVPGQAFACVSFLSPEDAVVDKDRFLMKKYLEYVSGLVRDCVESVAKEPERLQEFVGVLGFLNSDEVLSDFETWKGINGKTLDADFEKEHPFQCSVRGIKIRGAFPTLEKAEDHTKMLRQMDPNFDIYIAQVGSWCPWQPNPVLLKDAEYAETELNTLMHKYNEACEKKDSMFTKETERKKAVIQAENDAKKLAAGPSGDTEIVETVEIAETSEPSGDTGE